MAVPNTGANPNVNSTASFASDAFTYDPLYASETVAQSAVIAASLGVLKRGTVLLGAAAGTTMGTLTTASGVARAILAQDIDTGTGSAVTGLVYTQGKFLDTAMIFSTNGALVDTAQLQNIGIYVLTVEQRSGLLVPARSLPGTGGALPQAIEPPPSDTPAPAHHTTHHQPPPPPSGRRPPAPA